MDQKEFALAQIKPYYKDPSTCGFSSEGKCMNLTPDGRMCVAGKNLLPEVRAEYPTNAISIILSNVNGDQSLVFIPEAVGILDSVQWTRLQSIHDGIASYNKAEDRKEKENYLRKRCEEIALFTYEELIA